MNDTMLSEEKLLTRKQFLSVVGAAIGGVVLGQFLIPSKSKYVTEVNAYGYSTYGNTKT